MFMKKIVVAIDGPAGAGKSTIAKMVAKEKGFIYVDTGAMYRAMALYFIKKGINSSFSKIFSFFIKKYLIFYKLVFN